MSQKLLILQGEPHTGKTTYSKEFVSGKSDWIRISLDDLRNMKNNTFWLLNQEKYIKTVEYNMVKSALECGFNVCVDSCNIRRKTIFKWISLSKQLNVEIEFKKFNNKYL